MSSEVALLSFQAHANYGTWSIDPGVQNIFNQGADLIYRGSLKGQKYSFLITNKVCPRGRKENGGQKPLSCLKLS